MCCPYLAWLSVVFSAMLSLRAGAAIAPPSTKSDAPNSEATAVSPPAMLPADLALIPAGTFQMGDHFNEGSAAELPVHEVSLSAFFMDRHEVTKAKWDQVAAWASGHGYDITAADASGKATNHPVHSVTWFECVKWCNARSEMEGLRPCYSVEGKVYKANVHTPDCDWQATGYRLPTEAEWEKAARGGVAGRRFPWGDTDTIQHARANYLSAPYLDYDTSETRVSHPAYAKGEEPFSSPVGSFAPNGLGLYDMAGNLWEWCWNWYDGGYLAGAVETDPHGPKTGAYRVLRGGCWGFDASSARVSFRGYFSCPVLVTGLIGFRCVRLP